MSVEPAVLLNDVHKSYGSKEILKGLSMRVPKGSIYGLLGASGCGKTTLLTCIVGRKNLDSGDIWVLGGRPGTETSGVPGPRVGYMPQEIALTGEFTVKDAIYYFGRIFNMPEKLIGTRYYKLSSLLDLPPENRMLKNCSGGQQRRVSFAAAMVHMPELLILDEPTVGVDPVLRDRIWSYLVEVTQKENMTVIITTHYIEEARQSNVIGMMRDGILLAQESPTRLLQAFQVDYLEDAFLILCQRQEQGRLDNCRIGSMLQAPSDLSVASTIDGNNVGSLEMLTPNKKRSSKIKATKRSLFNSKRAHALLDKNFKQFYRNMGGAILILMLPVVQSIIFFTTIGGDPINLNLAIVNDETYHTLCPNFTKNESAIPYSFSSCHFRDMSCRFLEYLEHPMINKIEYRSMEKAKEAVRNGKILGILYMAENFTESLEKRIEDTGNAEDETVNFSQIKIWLDMSNRQLGQTLKYKLFTIYEDFQDDVMVDCKLPGNMYRFFNFKSFYGELDDTFTIFMTPGVVLTLIFFVDTLMTSQIIISDRLEGVWHRSTIAGVTSFEITLTHFIVQSIIVLIHTIEVVIITFYFFKIENTGSIWIIMFLVYLQGIAGMGFGFWISIVSNSYTMANIITTGSFYLVIFICGVMWPIQGQPLALQWVAYILPFTVAIDSFRNVLKKGWSISRMEVWNGLGVEILWIIFLATVSIYMIKMKR